MDITTRISELAVDLGGSNIHEDLLIIQHIITQITVGNVSEMEVLIRNVGTVYW